MAGGVRVQIMEQIDDALAWGGERGKGRGEIAGERGGERARGVEVCVIGRSDHFGLGKGGERR